MPETHRDRRLGVVANAIGFEMLRHDGRPVYIGSFGVEQIDATDEETERCLATAQRVLDHLDHLDHLP